jgi:hypothetical protein
MTTPLVTLTNCCQGRGTYEESVWPATVDDEATGAFPLDELEELSCDDGFDGVGFQRCWVMDTGG